MKNRSERFSSNFQLKTVHFIKHSLVSSGLISLRIPDNGKSRHENIIFRKSPTNPHQPRLTETGYRNRFIVTDLSRDSQYIIDQRRDSDSQFKSEICRSSKYRRIQYRRPTHSSLVKKHGCFFRR